MKPFEFKQDNKSDWYKVRRDLNKYFQDVNQELIEFFTDDYYHDIKKDCAVTIDIKLERSKK